MYKHKTGVNKTYKFDQN